MPDDPEQPSRAGPWRPLKNRLFRGLLLANLASDIGDFMQTVGAAWLMVSLGAGPVQIALIQTASSLPFFLLALPAGALGDIVDRRRLILITEYFMLAAAIALAVLTILGLMSPGCCWPSPLSCRRPMPWRPHHGEPFFRSWCRARICRPQRH